MVEEKKYSHISVERASDEAEETSAVRTIHGVENGEETFRVSSTALTEGERAASDLRASSPASASSASSPQTSSPVSQPSVLGAKTPQKKDTNDPKGQDVSRDTRDADDSGEVPFQRMQTIIIISLIVLIVAFFLYFNFLR